jgi:hypothetical protein
MLSPSTIADGALFMCFGVVALGIMVIGGVSGSQLGVAEEISSGLASTPSE